MIDLKTWSEFLFDLWKYIKKYHSNETDNFEAAVKDADAIMTRFGSRPLFNGIMFGFLEQKSLEAIRHQACAGDHLNNDTT